MSEDAFYQNDLVQSAVICKFEIMGEAAKKVPDKLRTANPEIQWKQMAGFRDVFIHYYNKAIKTNKSPILTCPSSF